MNIHLLFDFTVDKVAKTVSITREFDAALSLVWDAFTNAEMLDQWWAPKPFTSKTKYMDFRVGGRRFYAMVNPEGEETGWQIFHYTSITPKSNFTCRSVFTDKDETPLLPGADWDLSFTEKNTRPPARSGHPGGDDPAGREITKVSISIYFESPEELEKMMDMGFKEGFTATLNELSILLKTLKK